MRVYGIIPARYSSVRFPGKPLAIIKGKSLVRRVWERTSKARSLNEVIVATDNKLIASCARSFGAEVAITSVKCKSGTDRLAEVARQRGRAGDIFINIQGDEPIISPKLIDQLVEVLKRNPQVSMVTAVFPLTDKKDISNPNVVKAVVDQEGNAIYFSRSTIPYNRAQVKTCYYKHIGIYGYRKSFLLKYARMKQTPLEKVEQLEQLRAIENGYTIKTVVSKHDSYGVDVPKDISKLERLLK